MSTSDSIISAESGGNPNATNPNSTATGPGQFLSSTWLDTLAKHRPDIQGTPEQLLALRNDPALSRDMTAAYASDNQGTLAKAGLPVTPGTTYLAHFAGPGGALKVLQADPGTPVESLLGAEAVAANPFLKGMTAQGLQAWAAKKMGTTSPAAGPQGAPTAAGAPSGPQTLPAGATASAAPPLPAPGQAPIFAGQPQQAPQGQQMAQAAPAAAPMAPIFAPEPAPVDLSGLRAALAARRAPPLFARRG
jgi:hypothetical protein